jgi:GGDEF domain-containing protein
MRVLALAEAIADRDLRKAAATDPLTGLANRRQFDAAVEREWQRSLRTQSPIAQLMIDLDYFKLAHPGSSVADQVTLSVGVASHDEVCASLPRATARSCDEAGSAGLVSIADQALYAAKFGGRDHARWLSMHDTSSPARAIDLRDETLSIGLLPQQRPRRA